MATFDRITQQPGIMGGRACIRGTRVTVGMLIGQIAAGHTIEEIVSDYPYLVDAHRSKACCGQGYG